MFNLNVEHFEVFESIPYKEQIGLGSKVDSWAENVLGCVPARFKSYNRVNRQTLKELCLKDSGFTDIECIAAVMAWGGQNRVYGRLMFTNIKPIEKIVSQLRRQELDYMEAYNAFDRLWQSGEIKGIGAAYFTKLIFFCDPRHEGYIMDQWTAKSSNLLCDAEVVILQLGYVSKKNTLKNYEDFCNLVNFLSKKTKSVSSPEEIEIRMFSKGGRNKELWRKHVFYKYKEKPA